MPNYTQETASLKTITHDSTVIDTKVLKINGEIFIPFDPPDKEIKYVQSTIGQAKSANAPIDVPLEGDVITQTSVEGEFFVALKNRDNSGYRILGIYLKHPAESGKFEINVDVVPRDYYGYSFKLWE